MCHLRDSSISLKTLVYQMFIQVLYFIATLYKLSMISYKHEPVTYFYQHMYLTNGAFIEQYALYKIYCGDYRPIL